MSDDRIVLSLCDRTGNMVRPWLAAGWECWIVDMQHEPGEHRDPDNPLLVRVGADVTRWLPPRREYRIVFGFPPCTNLAVSGSRWFRTKGLAGLIDGLRVVEGTREIAEWCEAPWMIENPVSTLSSYWRKPDFLFDPCDYARLAGEHEAYTKRTCLWVGNGFVMPEPRPLPPELGSKMHRLPPSEDRGDLRSITPLGFARAVYLANHKESGS
jgi:hypothetical protein